MANITAFNPKAMEIRAPVGHMQALHHKRAKVLQEAAGRWSHTKRTAARSLVVKAFHIDHRKHMDLSWERQKRHEELLDKAAEDIAAGRVVDVVSLTHLEKCLEEVCGKIAVLALHSRSCGICKAMCGDLVEELAADVHSQRAGVIFLRHDIVNEFDFASDIAQFYGVKTVPKFLFLVDGAVVDSVSVSDIRRVSMGKNTLDFSVGFGRSRLKTTLYQLLVKNAPSARR